MNRKLGCLRLLLWGEGREGGDTSVISARPLLDTDLWALIRLGATQIHAAFKLRNYSLVLSPPSFPDTFSPLVSHPQLPAPASPPRFCAGAPPLIALAQAAARRQWQRGQWPSAGARYSHWVVHTGLPCWLSPASPTSINPPPPLPLPKPGAVTCGIEEIRSKIPREENNSECVAVNAPRSNPSKAENDTGYKCKAVKKVLISMPHGKQRPGPHVTFRRLKQ